MNFEISSIVEFIVKPLFEFAGIQFSALTIFYVLISLVIVFVIAKLIRKVIDRMLLSKTRIDIGARHAISTFTYYTVVVLGLLVVLSNIGVDMTSIALFGGAIGLGIGLGLQQTAVNFVSGVILLITRPITNGDRIKVDDIEATVLNIGGYSTTLVMLDKSEVIVPNSYLLDKPVTNWTLTDEVRAIRVPIGLHYKTNPKEAKAVLESAALQSEHVLRDPAPVLQFMAFGDSSLDFSLVVWTDSMVSAVPALKSELNYLIHEALAANSITVPYPQRDLHLVSSDVKLN